MNEIQVLDLDSATTILSLSNGGGSVNLAQAGSLWKKSGDELYYEHNNKTRMNFTPSAYEIIFGVASGKYYKSFSTILGEEFRYKSGNYTKNFAYGGYINEFAGYTSSNIFCRVEQDTPVTSYFRYVGQGPNYNISSYSDLYTRAQGIRILGFRASAVGGVGSLFTTIGNIRAGVFTATNQGGSLKALIGVADPTNPNSVVAGAYVDAQNRGIIFASGAKNFRMDHPTDSRKEIWYASVEGPEAGAYERGTIQLVNGEAFIPFSDHFKLVINPETMTVNIAPGSAQSLGLAVVEKTAEGIRVKELFNGTGNYSVDWEVKAVRKGFEDYKVIRTKGIDTPEVYEPASTNPNLPTVELKDK